MGKSMKKFDISNLMISRIVDIYSYTLEEETEAEAVTGHALLIVKHSGESVYTVGKEEWVADRDHILFLPAGTAYSMCVEKEGACTVIEFDTVQAGIDPQGGAYFTNHEADLVATVKNILHYWGLRGPAYHSKCLSEIYSLLTQISSIQSYAYTLAGKYTLIHRSVKYIEKNYGEQDLYIPMLARMSGIGETYYRSIFLAVFGVSPTKYIQQYRVEKAKERLVNSMGSVEEIALAVGFANASYFCKAFKAQTGLTPSEFAEKGRRIG